MVDLLALLTGALANPFVYFLLVFGLAILIAIILPIPIEIVLLLPLDPNLSMPIGQRLNLFSVALVAVALGKAVGAWLVFLFGLKVEKSITKWTERSKAFRRFVAALEKFVRRTGTMGLYILLSIPLMSDTAVLYFYALFNEEGKALEQRHFILSNFLAGVNRVALVFILGLTLIPGLLTP